MKKQTKKPEKIKKEMGFSEVLAKYPETADVFLRHGMTCISCPFAAQETIEQGSLAHGIDPKKLVAELNKRIKKKK